MKTTTINVKIDGHFLFSLEKIPSEIITEDIYKYIEDVVEIWRFEFDTVENRNKMKEQIMKFINSITRKTRKSKLRMLNEINQNNQIC